ncbi:MAG TPA: gluconate 2-dehydrogenase subunit 3 family protein [Xanthobacteraceae bacterium]|jgi:gluconate 2-dehydrogenase gamma chain
MSDDGLHDSIARRSFLKGAGAAGTAVATALSGALPAPAAAQTPPPAPAKEPSPPPAPQALLTLTATEAAFLSAAYDTFIPPDRLSPSGTDCGLVAFIDGQLAGAWGGGARLYRGGPFIKGTREQGYQLSLTPREFFAAGIRAANQWTHKTYGKDFDRLSAAERDTALKTMDAGKAEFDEIDAKQFFEMLLASAMEGFFADPMYGGNRDKVSWRMVGYPGLPATYASKALEYRGKKIVLEPQSIADFS